MIRDVRYKGIFFMLLAALGFSLMGGAAKALKESFTAGQLVFYRNAIGLIFLAPGLLIKPPIQAGGRPLRLAFRGLMGALALYTLLYCILHLPRGTAMSYNLTSALFIAIFSFLIGPEVPLDSAVRRAVMNSTGKFAFRYAVRNAIVA